MPALTPEQLQERQSFIGGSDAPAVCGVSPWRTAYQVYLEKIGQGEPVKETEAMYWGSIHEDNIATRYGERTGRTLAVNQATVRLETSPYLGCHVDRYQSDPHMELSKPGVIEIKTTRARLKPGECPESYIVQLYHNLICTQLTWGTVVILIQGSELVWYDYHLTPQIERSIIAIESKFWSAVEAKDWSRFGVE